MAKKFFRNLSLVLLILGALNILALHHYYLGWASLLLGALSLIGAERSFARHAILIFISIAILGTTPINTDISLGHMLTMGSALLLAVAVPFVITRRSYKEKVIRYQWLHGPWTRWHYSYILLVAVLGYLLLPFWMQDTGHYTNWTVDTSPWQLFVLFLGTNGLGIWDELFFIITVLALLRRHIPFRWANLVQACLFTIFLYELGFRGWAPLAIFPFALLQGFIFKKSESLLYIITVHLTLDLVLYLALINAHHPHLINIFITR